MARQTGISLFNSTTHYYFFHTYFCYFVYRVLLVTALYLFCLSSECISFVIFITFVYHNSLIAAPSVIGMWPRFFGKWSVVCAQAGPRWVTIGLVTTPSSRILGPSTVGGSLAQHHKKAHHKYNIILLHSMIWIIWYLFYDTLWFFIVLNLDVKLWDFTNFCLFLIICGGQSTLNSCIRSTP